MRPLDAAGQFLQEHGIRNCRIHAALSGGADSICLLDVLCRLRDAFGLEVHAVHVQHGLRGEESLRDEQFCRDFCEKRGIPLVVGTCNVQEYARSHRCSVETAARDCRYRLFETLCPEGFVATAHTASDNLETILFRMTRGTGLKGLCGIPPVRDRFLRPLLHVTRAEVEDYIAEQGLSYVTDSTNLEDVHTRNFLRMHVVPALRQCHPAAEDAVSHMADTLRAEQDFLAAAASAQYAESLRTDGGLALPDALHPALRRRCIAQFLAENGLPPDYRRITLTEQVLTANGHAELERGGLCAHVSHGVLYLLPPAETPADLPLKRGTQQLFPAVCLHAEVIAREDAEKFAYVHKNFTNCVLDYDIIKGYAVLHGRRPGLRLIPQGRAHHVSIKKWLNAEVSPARRPYVHFLSDADGLLWCEGLGAAAHAAVTDSTQRMLFLTISHQTDTMRTQS